MLNRKMLNQYLEEYHVKAGPLRKYRPLSWVTHLCDFASTLQDDSPLDAMQEAKLKEIMYLRPSNQPLCDDLFKKIYDALNGLTLDTTIAVTIDDLSILIRMCTYLRPEHIAQLMMLSKGIYNALRHHDLWRDVCASHFYLAFRGYKNNATVDWLQLVKSGYNQYYYNMIQKREKALLSSAKSGDLYSLIMLDLKMDDLHLSDKDSDGGFSIFSSSSVLYCYASKSLNKTLSDFIYGCLILPFYTENGEINYGKKDKKGFTYLHWAAAFERFDHGMLANFQRPGALDVVSNAGETPLYIAAQSGCFGAVKALIVAGADVNIAAGNSATPLGVAASLGYVDIVNALIGARANVNATFHKRSMLFMVVWYGHLDVLNALLAAEADVNVYWPGESIETLLSWAVLRGHLDILNVLIKAGANVNIIVNDGPFMTKTLPDLAKKHKHLHIAKRLSYVKLKQTIDTIAHAPVSRNAVTLFGKTIKYAYSNEETLAAAIALKMAVKSGDQTLLDEHRQVLEKAKELSPLYRHLI